MVVSVKIYDYFFLFATFLAFDVEIPLLLVLSAPFPL